MAVFQTRRRVWSRPVRPSSRAAVLALTPVDEVGTVVPPSVPMTISSHCCGIEHPDGSDQDSIVTAASLNDMPGLSAAVKRRGGRVASHVLFAAARATIPYGHVTALDRVIRLLQPARMFSPTQYVALIQLACRCGQALILQRLLVIPCAHALLDTAMVLECLLVLPADAHELRIVLLDMLLRREKDAVACSCTVAC